jgi:hypothetical protein
MALGFTISQGGKLRQERLSVSRLHVTVSPVRAWLTLVKVPEGNTPCFGGSASKKRDKWGAAETTGTQKIPGWKGGWAEPPRMSPPAPLPEERLPLTSAFRKHTKNRTS